MRELHVQLRLSFPGDPIAVRRKLIDAIEDEVGEVGDTGTGGGVMDLWLRAAKPQAAARTIRRIAKRLGIAEWTEVTVRPRRIEVEILCDDAYPLERAEAAAEALQHEIAIAADRWAELTGHGVSDGVVEIQMEVRDPAEAIARLEALAKRLGIADRVRIDER